MEQVSKTKSRIWLLHVVYTDDRQPFYVPIKSLGRLLSWVSRLTNSGYVMEDHQINNDDMEITLTMRQV